MPMSWSKDCSRGLMLALKEASGRSFTTEIEGGVEIEVTPELLLFGLLASAQATDSLGSESEVDLAELLRQVEASLPGESDVAQPTAPYGQESLHARRTPELQQVVDHAEDEAAKAGRDEVQVGDLLVGILLHEGSPAADLLGRAGVTVDQLRAQSARWDDRGPKNT